MNAVAKNILGTMFCPSILALAVASHAAEISENARSDFPLEEAVLVVSPPKPARNRVDTISSVLSYDIEFFQRFEPANLGEMLRRVPGLYIDSLYPDQNVFADTESSVFGFRGAFGNQVRGTVQVLINGRRVPGFGPDGALSFSAIPFEMVKEIRVIRNGTPNIDSQGFALTVDVILRDGSEIPREKSAIGYASLRSVGDESGYVLGGSLRKNFAETWQFSANINIDDGGRTSKTLGQSSTIPEDDQGIPTPEAIELFETSRFDNQVDIEQQGLRLNLERFFDQGGYANISAHRFNRDREDNGTRLVDENTEFEFTEVFKNKDSVELQGIAGELRFGFGDNSPFLRLQGSIDETEMEYFIFQSDDLEDDGFRRIDDRESTRFSIDGGFEAGERFNFNAGVIWHRETLNQTDFFEPLSLDIGERFLDFKGLLEKETLSTYVMADIALTEKVTWNLGVRNEDLSVKRDSTQVLTAIETDFTDPLLSTHLRWVPKPEYDFRIAYSEALAHPLDYAVIPQIYIDATSDEFNTNLVFNSATPQPVTVEKLEVGADYRFADQKGIIGISIFSISSDDYYDEITIEGFEASRSFVAESNAALLEGFDSLVGEDDTVSSTAYERVDQKFELNGAELDLSVPLEPFGIPNMHFATNLSVYERKEGELNAVRSSAFNFTLEHNIGQSFAYGLSYNRKSDETLVFVDDDIENKTTYSRDPTLDIFLEKRFGNYVVTRLVVENALDSESRINTKERRLPFVSPDFIESEASDTDPALRFVMRAAF